MSSINDDLNAFSLLHNSRPIDDFLGLSPAEMHYLLYSPLSAHSPVRFRETIGDETLDKIPLFRIAEDYLKIIQREGHIKLTPLGALPKKVMTEIYDKGYLPDELIESGITKLSREHDCISIMSARIAAEAAGLVKKLKGKLLLTKAAGKLLAPDKRMELFKVYFEAFTGKFAWSFNDGYDDPHTAQFGWAFSVFALNKFGDQPRVASFYADKYIHAFPDADYNFEDTVYTSSHNRFVQCYVTRTLSRFLAWFGFVEIRQQGKSYERQNDLCMKSKSLNEVFEFDD